ncbi:MAG: hypothetical protein ACI8W7_001527 [Gammaproteobacteria bacterium]|jgi:hypothetical protein
MNFTTMFLAFYGLGIVVLMGVCLAITAGFMGRA